MCYSSECPIRRHFCGGFTVSHQAWAFAVHFPVIIWAPERKRCKMGSRFYFNLKREGWEEVGCLLQVSHGKDTLGCGIANSGGSQWHDMVLNNSSMPGAHAHTVCSTNFMNAILSPSLMHYSQAINQRQPLEQCTLWCLTVPNPCNSWVTPGDDTHMGGKWVYGRKGNDQISKFNCVSDKTGPECH